MMLSDVCLSVTYIGPKSRTERHRKTKIGTEAAHVRRDSDTTFKVKRSRSPGRFTHCGINASGNCSGQRGNVFCMGKYCYVASVRRRARRLGAHRGRRRAGHIVSPHAQLDTIITTTECIFRTDTRSLSQIQWRLRVQQEAVEKLHLGKQLGILSETIDSGLCSSDCSLLVGGYRYDST